MPAAAILRATARASHDARRARGGLGKERFAGRLLLAVVCAVGVDHVEGDLLNSHAAGRAFAHQQQGMGLLASEPGHLIAEPPIRDWELTRFTAWRGWQPPHGLP